MEAELYAFIKDPVLEFTLPIRWHSIAIGLMESLDPDNLGMAV